MKRRAPPTALIITAVATAALLLMGIVMATNGGLAKSRPQAEAAVADAPQRPPRPLPAVTAPVVEATPPSDGGLDYLTHKAQAEENLKAILSDDHGVRYRNVETRLSTMDGGGIIAFCGWVNSKTPLGGYSGFQRFVASRSVATTEARMSADDFDQAWQRFCVDGVQGPKVWF